MKQIVIFLLLVLCSCGAMKKHKTDVKETVKIVSTLKEKETVNSELLIDENIKTSIVTQVDIQNGECIETTTNEPIDKTKPGFVVEPDGKKTTLDNIKQTKIKKTVLSNDKSKVISNIEKKKMTAQNEQKSYSGERNDNIDSLKKTSALDKERKDNFWWLFWLALFVVLIRIAYCLKTKTPLF